MEGIQEEAWIGTLSLWVGGCSTLGRRFVGLGWVGCKEVVFNGKVEGRSGSWRPRKAGGSHHWRVHLL